MKSARKVLSENIQSLLKDKKIDQRVLAAEIGVSDSSVSQWLNEAKYPRIQKIEAMAEYFKVPKSRLTEEQIIGNEYTNMSTYKYPYYPTTISAGILNSVDAITESDITNMMLPDMLLGKYARRKDIWFTRINGDSMNNRIPDGSLIGVLPIEDIHSLNDGDIVIFSDQNEFSVKRFYRFDNKFVFRPDSNKDCFFDYTILSENAQDLKIHGKVVVYVVELD